MASDPASTQSVSISGDTAVIEACLAGSAQLALGAPLPRLGEKLRRGEPVTIVAIGSSSTTGFGTLSSASSFPDVMRRELLELRPSAALTVINSGRAGDTIPGNLARFDADVMAHKPDLVIWQLGTNDIVWGGGIDGLRERVGEGIRQVTASGAEMVLMDLQYAPAVLSSAAHPAMQELVADAARRERVGLFQRFALMKRAIDAGVARGDLVGWDGLHNTRAGYACIGQALARSINAAAASAPPGRRAPAASSVRRPASP